MSLNPPGPQGFPDFRQKGGGSGHGGRIERALARLAQVARRDLDRHCRLPRQRRCRRPGGRTQPVADISFAPALSWCWHHGLCRILRGRTWSSPPRAASTPDRHGEGHFGNAFLPRAGVPVIALCGTLGRGYQEVYKEGVTAVLPIIDAPMSLEQAMAETARSLSAASSRALRLLLPRWLPGKGKGIM